MLILIRIRDNKLKDIILRNLICFCLVSILFWFQNLLWRYICSGHVCECVSLLAQFFCNSHQEILSIFNSTTQLFTMKTATYFQHGYSRTENNGVGIASNRGKNHKRNRTSVNRDMRGRKDSTYTKLRKICGFDEFIVLYNFLKSGCVKMGISLFCQAACDRRRGNGPKLHQGSSGGI